MKKFYDRAQEMARLKDVQRQAYEDCSRFVVLTGRRRVGKTSLVYRLMTTRLLTLSMKPWAAYALIIKKWEFISSRTRTDTGWKSCR